MGLDVPPRQHLRGGLGARGPPGALPAPEPLACSQGGPGSAPPAAQTIEVTLLAEFELSLWALAPQPGLWHMSPPLAQPLRGRGQRCQHTEPGLRLAGRGHQAQCGHRWACPDHTGIARPCAGPKGGCPCAPTRGLGSGCPWGGGAWNTHWRAACVSQRAGAGQPGPGATRRCLAFLPQKRLQVRERARLTGQQL